MSSYKSILLLFSFVLSAAARPRVLTTPGGPLRGIQARSDCTTVFTATADVNGASVLLETLACSSLSASSLPAITVTSVATVAKTSTVVATATVAPPAPLSVDKVPCNTFCSDGVGQLPPISEDCEVIQGAITTFVGTTAPSFTVAPKSIQQLTFGTCRFFFANFANPKTLSYTWVDFNATASKAGLSCFPPVQPVNSLGLCESVDSTWQVGASHS
ncbi:hypothetical protein FA95DRAFT_1570813 [Auriscalpium vulgare]|uniref:Uncharacterized protein n=1 Tax=Auriscalpium vulgare TaxID=40419 RepID=A0ACB8S2C1_9AGAM|nr:hypothetical protein FA95DRAFT_1570813 [Auriscalpium vulgare]